MKNKKPIQIRRKRKSSKTAGLAPGTISYTGDNRDFDTNIEMLCFNEFDLKDIPSIASPDIEKASPDGYVRWINVNGIHDVDTLTSLGEIFKLHNLVLEDIAHIDQRPKLDEYDNYIYIVAQMVRYDSVEHEIHTEQLSIIVSDTTLISFQEEPGDLFDGIRERIRGNTGKIRKSGVNYLLYTLIDTIVDHYFVVLEKLGDDLDDIEVRLLGEARNEDVAALHGLKRELIMLRKSVWPMRELIGNMSKSERLLSKDNTVIYLRDVYDHCIRAIDTLETYREMSSSLMDMYLSSLSNRMNTVMKTLTIISTIFIPLTFIVGVYGMNFENMPELKMNDAYWYVWGVMIAITVVMIRYFKKKGWF